MTDDKLLPLPDAWGCGSCWPAAQDYARANVAERDAEIARLRERVERLEAALREIRDFPGDPRVPVYCSVRKSAIARAALADGEAASA